MKVCDAHPNIKAVDSIAIESDDTRIDMCADCRNAVFAIFGKTELGDAPIAPPKGDAPQKGPKRGHSSFGR